MTDTPKPATTLSDEDAEVLADPAWGIYRGDRERRLETVVRKLDAECVALRERLLVTEDRERLALRVLALVETPGREVTKRMIDAFEQWCGPNTDCHAVKNYALDALLAYAKETLSPASDAAPKEAT